MKTDQKVVIVIPYLPSAAQGRELDYAIAGWRKHFKEPYHIAVVGEGLPIIKGDDVTCIESKRVAPIEGQYRQHLDYVSCFRKAHYKFPDTDGFIFVADDCYAVNDFDISDVKFLRMLNSDFNFYSGSANAWRRDKQKTKIALLEKGLPTRNFTTHIPHWFEWEKWESLVNQYNMDRESYVIEDLYYNTYYPNRVPFKLSKEEDNLKLGIYTDKPDIKEIENAFKKKIWITNSPEGFVKELDLMLKKHYGL